MANKLLFFALMSFLSMVSAIGCGETINTSAFKTGVYLSWQAPVLDEEGIFMTDLAGYRVHYGESPSVYTDIETIGTDTQFYLGDLPVGIRLYFSVTAFDTSGNESFFSSEISTILENK